MFILPVNGFHVVVSHRSRLLKVSSQLALRKKPGLDLPCISWTFLTNAALNKASLREMSLV